MSPQVNFSEPPDIKDKEAFERYMLEMNNRVFGHGEGTNGDLDDSNLVDDYAISKSKPMEITGAWTLSGIFSFLVHPENLDHTQLDNIGTKSHDTLDTEVDLNTTHAGSDGTDHSNVVLNDTHRSSDGKDHSDVVLANTHRADTTIHLDNESLIAFLSSSASVDLDGTPGTETSLYTVPASKTCIVTHIKIRTLSASAASAVVTFGKTGGSCDEFRGDQILSGLDGTTKYTVIYLDQGTNDTPEAGVMLNAADVVGVEITTAHGSAVTCTIDVFGYLFE